ncbi:MAG: hypothetical protein F4Y39_10755 [Gemmatimonadetes bacterium]|nr:hypothetical protein [Gemmatimonadota bacterium]MYK52610.1 hypothetical protein [Gemmatimonadota bacterium]
MDKPYTIVQRDKYKLTIYRGIAPLGSNNDNVDVQVTFPNGERFSAVFFTLRNIEALMRRYKKTGECADGLYFGASDMIIVESLTEKTICKTIDHLLAEDEFGYIFSKNEDPKDVSSEEGDKLFECFDESLKKF